MSDQRRTPALSERFADLPRNGLHTHDDEVFVVVTQAYDGYGNQLVHDNGPTFDGFPGVRIFIELSDGRHGYVVLSPIHGDSRKVGFTDVEPGTKCVVRAKKGAPELIADEDCVCGGGTYRRIYLTPQLDEGQAVHICDVWGCYRSRIRAESELLSWIEY